MAEIYESKTQNAGHKVTKEIFKSHTAMEERIADFLGIDKMTGRGGSLRMTLENNLAKIEWDGFMFVTGDKLKELLDIIREEAR